MANTFHPNSEADLAATIREGGKFRAIGGQSKPALSHCPEDWTPIRLNEFSGITEYDSSEFTITARAATPLSELRNTLDENDQFMPFDPPLIDQGASIGGTIAAGLSGPGMLRYGTVRDFVLHVRLVDGLGNIAYAGGKVVKNAAGFDIPKLMVGSLGRLGIMTEVTMKVFPKPESHATVSIETETLSAALELQSKLARMPLGLEAIDFVPPGQLVVRVAGSQIAVQRLCKRLGSVCESESASIALSSDDAMWNGLSTWQWGANDDERVIKVPIAPREIVKLEALLNEQHVPRRYCAAGNVVWIRWPGERPIRLLEELLDDSGHCGLVLTGQVPRVRIGKSRKNLFAQRIKSAMDPNGVFGALE